MKSNDILIISIKFNDILRIFEKVNGFLIFFIFCVF
jgi:hypothetical protein